MDIHLRKVTARVDLKAGNSFARAPPASRPGSPTKKPPTSSLSPPPFRPKAKVNSSATVRKLSSSSSLNIDRAKNPPSISRPNSPFKLPRTFANAGPSDPPRSRITARPTSKSGISPVQTSPGSPESRQRALTTVATKLKPPHLEERPRSGSVVALHHALSSSDLKRPPSPTLSQSSHFFEHSSVDNEPRNSSPVLAPIKIKSRVTRLAKFTSTSAGDPASRSLSPPWATTRPIHTRVRAPSITSSFSLNDPPTTSPSSPFYPITTGSPAANPHRYAVPRRAQSPVRSHQPLIASKDPPIGKVPLIPRVDTASVPLPPHSPPTSILSLSSKSSVSRTSLSLNTDQSPGDQESFSIIVSNLKRRSIEWNRATSSVFFPQSEYESQIGREGSGSQDMGLRDSVPENRHSESDVESEGSEGQLRAEAKTNRKIADLEITNRSLLAINASLETTKNHQAKEIRDLRRKLRESRLILPPRQYKTINSALVAEDGRDDEDDEDDSEEIEEGADDETFQRVRGLIEGLVESGKRALEEKPEDLRANIATKVLNADELRSWQDSGQRSVTSMSYLDHQDADDETIHWSPALIAMLDGATKSLAQSNRELTSRPASRSSSSPLPPITVTPSL
ncbi:hypothetical protein PAXRUDRAFT_831110 [Paxillus rubicundulus Ve08.2h10]|uniref:Uncharacterized protein n=1 Tax=Paxillus rubicundulus Ve08.2h10 TaxID=930991 RepID=A0A0D0DSI2_9AGAM|nr:hypothetical protein PAXRUDRAFT_831110 [Paxillus rubicundulus Ve08.2h10]